MFVPSPSFLNFVMIHKFTKMRDRKSNRIIVNFAKYAANAVIYAISGTKFVFVAFSVINSSLKFDFNHRTIIHHLQRNNVLMEMMRIQIHLPKQMLMQFQ